MKIQEYLSELAQKLMLPDLKLDDQDCCRLVFDESITVDIEYDDAEKRVFIYSAVAALPVQNKGQIYEDLLRDNLFGRQTAGACFAVNAVDGDIVLYHSCQAETIDFIEFCNWLETFVSTVEFWSDELYKRGMIKEETGKETGFSDQHIIRA